MTDRKIPYLKIWLLVFFGFLFYLPDRAIASDSHHDIHPFPISEKELNELAQTLAPKVDLFSAVWAIDPEAEFYAGTTRDFLYWILGHFRNLKSKEEIDNAKKALIDLPFIKFIQMVGPDSDADIMTKLENQLGVLRADEFAIRKLDFVSFERTDPNTVAGQTEILQGYIPTEKLRISKNGIVPDKKFGNGMREIISGNLSVSFPDPAQFWNTLYAKEGTNHPALLAARYLRILSQDYLRRYGNDYPRDDLLIFTIDPKIRSRLKEIFRTAALDPKFEYFLSQPKGRAWMNGAIQKAFRSFTNATAAFQLMKEMGLLELIEVFPKQLESVHGYLLQTKSDSDIIQKNLSAYKVSADQLYQSVDQYLPQRELYHGAGSESAFRNLIFQGVIPSSSGLAGRGLYGVDESQIEFARNWSLSKSGSRDLVIALKLSPDAKVVDISKGMGKKIFDEWLATSRRSDQATYDQFAADFGADLLVYPYSSPGGQAFVLKNAKVIEARRSVFLDILPIDELIKRASLIDMEHRSLPAMIKSILISPLARQERLRIISKIPRNIMEESWNKHWSQLENYLGDQVYQWIEINFETMYAHLAALKAADLLRTLYKEKAFNALKIILKLKFHQVDWPPAFWNFISEMITWPEIAEDLNKKLVAKWIVPPELLENLRPFLMNSDYEIADSASSHFLRDIYWTEKTWNQIPYYLLHPHPIIRSNIFVGLATQKVWPLSMKSWLFNFLDTSEQYLSDDLRSIMKTPSDWISSWSYLIYQIYELNIYGGLKEWIQSKAYIPDEFWRAIAYGLSKDHMDVLNRILKLLSSASNIRSIEAKDIQNRLEHIFLNRRSIIRDVRYSIRMEFEHYLIGSILKLPDWRESIWNEMFVILQAKDEYADSEYHSSASLVAHRLLDSTRRWPLSFWQKIPDLLRDRLVFNEVKIDLLKSILYQTEWPEMVHSLIAEFNSDQILHPYIASLKTVWAEKKRNPSVGNCEYNLKKIDESPASDLSPN